MACVSFGWLWVRRRRRGGGGWWAGAIWLDYFFYILRFLLFNLKTVRQIERLKNIDSKSKTKRPWSAMVHYFIQSSQYFCLLNSYCFYREQLKLAKLKAHNSSFTPGKTHRHCIHVLWFLRHWLKVLVPKDTRSSVAFINIMEFT